MNVRKDIYLHVPPPEFEEPEVAPTIVASPSTTSKHYKILFIKTPSYAPRPIAAAALRQNYEEKTLVYVLVKKPEPVESVAQTIVQSKTDKPEVR